MTDDLGKVNKTLYGSQDALPFNMGANGEVHRVDSGRVDPNLTRYVGSEAAKELRGLFEGMYSHLESCFEFILEEQAPHNIEPTMREHNKALADYRARLDHILGLLHR